MAGDGGVTARLVYAVASVTFGTSFQCGYNLAVMNAPQDVIRQFIADVYFDRRNETISDDQLDLLYSVATTLGPGGGILGGMLVAILTNKLGRKRSILLNAANSIIGGVLMTLCKTASSYEMLMIGRFFIGVSMGLGSGAVPLYMNEISPKSVRGAIGSMHQFMVVAASVLAVVLGQGYALGTTDLWPFLLGIVAIPGVIQVITLVFAPESPRYLLISKDKVEEAKKALVYFRGAVDITEETRELQQEKIAEDSAPKVSVLQLFTNRLYRQPLLISLVVHAGQQLTGINALVYYSTTLLEEEFGDNTARLITLVMQCVNLTFTIVSVLVVERLGRRMLLLGGFILVAIMTVLVVVFMKIEESHSWGSYAVVVSIMLYVAFFALGPASIPWFLTSELFPQAPRPAAVSISVLVNWGANTFVSLTFLILLNAMAYYAFFIYTGLTVAAIIYLAIALPETKNKRIEEITAHFARRIHVSPSKSDLLDMGKGDANGVLNKSFDVDTEIGEQDGDITKF